MTAVRKARKSPEENGPLRAAGYVRVSDAETQGRHGASLAAQRERIAGQCTARGWELVRVYSDKESGKDLKRPGLQKMLEDAKRGDFQAVVITKLDRLSRSVKDWGQLQEDLHRLGIALVSISEALDDTTAVGRMMSNIIAAFAQMERELISERTKTVLQHKKKHHEVYSRRIPFGFRRKGDTLVPDPQQYSIVQSIFKQRKAQPPVSYRAIAAALTKRGISSPLGHAEWTAQTVWKICQNASLYGQATNDVL